MKELLLGTSLQELEANTKKTIIRISNKDNPYLSPELIKTIYESKRITQVLLKSAKAIGDTKLTEKIEHLALINAQIERGALFNYLLGIAYIGDIAGLAPGFKLRIFSALTIIAKLGYKIRFNRKDKELKMKSQIDYVDEGSELIEVILDIFPNLIGNYGLAVDTLVSGVSIYLNHRDKKELITSMEELEQAQKEVCKEIKNIVS